MLSACMAAINLLAPRETGSRPAYAPLENAVLETTPVMMLGTRLNTSYRALHQGPVAELYRVATTLELYL